MTETLVAQVPEVSPAPAAPGRRDFTLLWAGSAVSQAGTLAGLTATPLLILTLTHSPLITSWATMAATLPGLLMHLPAGLLADAIDRRKMMMYVQAARVVVGMALVIGLVCFDKPIPLIIAAAFLDGSLASFYLIAETTAIRHVTANGEVIANMAKNEARQHIAISLGRPLGAILFGLGRSLPYLFDVVTSLISLLALRSISVKRFQDAERTGLTWPEARGFVRDQVAGFGEGLHLVRRDSFLLLSACLCAIANFVLQTVFLLSLVRAEQQHLSTSLIGLLLTTSGVCGLLGSIAAPRVLRGRVRGMTAIACAWLWAALVCVVAMSDDPRVGLLAWGACSVVGAHMNVALAVRQVDTIPDALLGRVTSFIRFVTGGAVPFGAACAGLLLGFASTGTAALLAAWLTGGVAVLATVHLAVRNRAYLRKRLWRLGRPARRTGVTRDKLGARPRRSACRERTPCAEKTHANSAATG